MDWNSVNWAQVCVVVAAFAVLTMLGGAVLVTKIEAMHERAKRELTAQHQAFLRGEYARLAGESTIWQGELRSLIGEVHGMALALKDAMASPEWDPEKHLETLSLLDAGASRMSVAMPPVPFEPAEPA